MDWAALEKCAEKICDIYNETSDMMNGRKRRWETQEWIFLFLQQRIGSRWFLIAAILLI